MNINFVEQYFLEIILDPNIHTMKYNIVFRLANFVDEKIHVRSHGGSGINEYVAAQFDATLDWNDVKWLVKYELHI